MRCVYSVGEGATRGREKIREGEAEGEGVVQGPEGIGKGPRTAHRTARYHRKGTWSTMPRWLPAMAAAISSGSAPDHGKKIS